ncbi:hypothetical protein CR513_51082, partial [Mucuna pruriens]
MADKGTSDGLTPSLCGRGHAIRGKDQLSHFYHSHLNLRVNNSYCPMGHTSYAHGLSIVISWIIRENFDEPRPTWKKVRLPVRNMWLREFKDIKIQWAPSALEVVEKTK